MTDLEDRLADLLTRSADAVGVVADLDRVVHPSPLSRARRRYPYVVGLVAAGAAGAIALTQLLPSPDHDDRTRTGGPTTTTVPQLTGMPRYLITAPGWTVDFAEDIGSDRGYMDVLGPNDTFLGLEWFPGDEWDQQREQWGVTDGGPSTQVAGHDAFASSTRLVVLWLAGGHGFMLRGNTLRPPADLASVMASIEQVDQATWEAALPDEALLSDERAALVDQTLAQLPLPTGLDTAALRTPQKIAGSETDVRSEVTTAVICGWVDQWIEATASGDTAAKAEAVGTIGSWRTWPTTEGFTGGDWGANTDRVAEAMAADRPVNDDTSIPQGTTYLRAIGCPEG